MHFWFFLQGPGAGKQGLEAIEGPKKCSYHRCPFICTLEKCAREKEKEKKGEGVRSKATSASL